MIYDNTDRIQSYLEGPFACLCSLAEFAEAYNVDASAVRHAIKNGKLQIGVDCMKFGKQWVMSRHAFQALDGHYGKHQEICIKGRKILEAAGITVR